MYTYVCGNHPPVPGPFLPALAALWLSSSLSPSLSSLSLTAVAVLCYRKRCGPRSAATSSTLVTHTTDAFRDYTEARTFNDISLLGHCTGLEMHFSTLPFKGSFSTVNTKLRYYSCLIYLGSPHLIYIWDHLKHLENLFQYNTHRLATTGPKIDSLYS